MSDPARIDRILDKLRVLWKAYPDQRLGQIIENNVIPSGELRGALTYWLFGCEDEVAEFNLDKSLVEMKKWKRNQK